MIMPFDEDKQLAPEAKEQLDKSENEIENIIEQGKKESEKAEKAIQTAHTKMRTAYAEDRPSIA